MRIVYFTHSLRSCWNHGNAHFLRGILRDLCRRGHQVTALEPLQSWSVDNLVADAGAGGLSGWKDAYPDLETTLCDPGQNPAALVEHANLVIVHEWNDPALVASIGAIRRTGAPFTLLFHDTHHRAVSDPEAMRRYDLSGYDGVLAFGDTLAALYRQWGWGDRVFTWHEAADTTHFQPPAVEQDRTGAIEQDRTGAVWIGNWGDGERTAELQAFLLEPAAAGIPLDIYGVRYPALARAMLAFHGATYNGWLPNHRVPEIFARHLLTIHVPRRFYTTALPGIPTIRVFEALACGIPLISAPWTDSESLFTPGEDYLVARTGAEMQAHIRMLQHDPDRAAALVSHGLATIRARHTCAHRVDELLSILHRLDTRTGT